MERSVSLADRPTISNVVSMFNMELVLLPSPKQPAFSIVRGMENSGLSLRKPKLYSVNDVTFSIMEAR